MRHYRVVGFGLSGSARTTRTEAIRSYLAAGRRRYGYDSGDGDGDSFAAGAAVAAHGAVMLSGSRRAVTEGDIAASPKCTRTTVWGAATLQPEGENQ